MKDLGHYIDQVLAPLVIALMGIVTIYAKLQFERWQKRQEAKETALAKLESDKMTTLERVENERRERKVLEQEQRNRIEEAVNGMMQIMPIMARQIETVEHEVKENSGLSLKDGVNHIRREMRVGMEVRRQALNVATFESIILKSGKTQVIAVSDAWTRLTGQSMEHIANNGWLKSVAPKDRSRVRQALKEAMAEGADMDVIYTNVHVSSGTECEVRHIAHPVCEVSPDGSSKIIGWYGKLLVISPPPHFHRRATDDPLAARPVVVDAPTPDHPLLPNL